MICLDICLDFSLKGKPSEKRHSRRTRVPCRGCLRPLATASRSSPSPGSWLPSSRKPSLVSPTHMPCYTAHLGSRKLGAITALGRRPESKTQASLEFRTGLSVPDHGFCPLLPSSFYEETLSVILAFLFLPSCLSLPYSLLPSISPSFSSFTPALFHGRLEATFAFSPPPDRWEFRPARGLLTASRSTAPALGAVGLPLGCVSGQGDLAVTPSSPTLITHPAGPALEARHWPPTPHTTPSLQAQEGAQGPRSEPWSRRLKTAIPERVAPAASPGTARIQQMLVE